VRTLQTIDANTSVLEAAQVLWERTELCLPVINDKGAVLGSIDTKDILVWFRDGHDIHTSAADAVAVLKRRRNARNLVVPDTTPVWTLVEILAESALRAVLWSVKLQSIVGMVSTSDLLSLLLKRVSVQDSEHAPLHKALCAVKIQDCGRDLSALTVSQHCSLRSAVGMLTANQSTRALAVVNDDDQMLEVFSVSDLAGVDIHATGGRMEKSVLSFIQDIYGPRVLVTLPAENATFGGVLATLVGEKVVHQTWLLDPEVHTHTHTCTHTHSHIYEDLQIHAHTYTYTHSFNTHTHTHTHTHAHIHLPFTHTGTPSMHCDPD
jgi:CBS-domain-containing membrane protein